MILSENKGSTLIIVILLMGLLLFLSLYYLEFSSMEKKISDSQFKGLETYHLAEAGIEEMIWRLKNNETYKNNFESDPDWSASFNRSNPFGPGSGSYEVSIQNTGLAQGNIVSTGTKTTVFGSLSQRVVKTKVYKAIASSSKIDDVGILGGHDIEIFLSDVIVSTSSLQANHDVTVSGLETDLFVDHDLIALNDFDQSFLADVHVGGDIIDGDSTPAPEELEMPSVSFDNPEDPDSYKSRADIIYTEDEFEDLIDNADGGSLILDSEIIYVEGEVKIDKDVDLIINGLLVANGDITLGDPYGFLSCWGNYTDLTINHEDGFSAGLIANGDITFDYCMEGGDIHGVVYATKDFIFTDFSNQITIVGAIFAREVGVFSVWQDLEIIYGDEEVQDTLQTTEFSPVVTVEHWEEEY